MSDKYIVLISHCFMNNHSKVRNYNKKQIEGEAMTRGKILSLFTENDIGIIQLPCPEVILYGLKRWGHVKDQFNHFHFVKECQAMLLPLIEQVQEYLKNGYSLFGVIGIERSPSCGILKTYRGEWKGEISGNPLIEDNRVRGISLSDERGLYMEILEQMICAIGIAADFYGYCPMECDGFYERISKRIREL